MTENQDVPKTEEMNNLKKRNSTTKCRSNRPADQETDSGLARRQSISGVVRVHEVQSHGAGEHSYRGRQCI